VAFWGDSDIRMRKNGCSCHRGEKEQLSPPSPRNEGERAVALNDKEEKRILWGCSDLRGKSWLKSPTTRWQFTHHILKRKGAPFPKRILTLKGGKQIVLSIKGKHKSLAPNGLQLVVLRGKRGKVSVSRCKKKPLLVLTGRGQSTWKSPTSTALQGRRGGAIEVPISVKEIHIQSIGHKVKRGR